MSFLKKLFGAKETKEVQAIPEEKSVPSNEDIPWMTDLRRETLSVCLEAGFKPAPSLPTEFNRQLRPSIEIARRLHAIKALVLWLLVPQENLSDEKIIKFIEENELEGFMSDNEKMILSLPRDDEAARDAIGWKFENAWPLAWYFGYPEPGIDGVMMTGEQMRDIVKDYTCPLTESVKDWASGRSTVSEERVIKMEDLFYCLHNAVRSAQLGGDTVPGGFDPIGNGGVIHERRHSLTWMLSKDVDWEETDLST